MEGHREMGGGESFVMTAPARGAVKQKVKETETEDLAGRGLEKQHWERQSNPLLSFRHVVTVHYLDFK